jgi:hypothetical protein
MSNKRKIYGKGRIEGSWTPLRTQMADSTAWKQTSFGARLLYMTLLRRLSFSEYNNGKIFRSTRDAAKDIGASQRVVCVWFRELEHYGFIVTTEPGCLGPKGRATRYRLTDWAWGELDGNPVQATKDYLKWDGEIFSNRPEMQKIGERKSSVRIPKVVTADDQKYSATPPTDDQRYSEVGSVNREQKYSDLVQPYPSAHQGATAAAGIGRNAEPPLDDLAIPTFLRRGHPDCRCP